MLKRDTVYGLTFSAVVILGVIIVPIWLLKARMARDYEEYRSLLLMPDGIEDVGGLLRLDPDIQDAFSITKEDSISLVVMLEPPSGTRHIYSGPPAYIFDDQGRFVYWSQDIGDDSEFWRRWPITETNRVSKDSLREFVEPGA